jgi:hypothetical protein
LEGGRNLDQLQPDVAIARSQVDSADPLLTGGDEVDIVVADQRAEEASLLALLPRPVGALDQLPMRLLMQVEQPLVIGGGGRLERHLR